MSKPSTCPENRKRYTRRELRPVVVSLLGFSLPDSNVNQGPGSHHESISLR